jgi:hypothetical protein
MSAIERCRTAALGGHVARCENGECGRLHPPRGRQCLNLINQFD